MWPDLKTDHFHTTSEMYFVTQYHRYNIIYHSYTIKHSDKLTRNDQVCFSKRDFLSHAKHWKTSTDGGGLLGGSNRMTWTQIISETLASSSVVVCDCCGDLFGIWLELEVPLGVFSYWNPVAAPQPHHPPYPPTPYKCYSWYYSHASKPSQNQAGKTISDD